MSEAVSCPNCKAKDLIGPIDEGFQCHKCGWSFEYGKLTTAPYHKVFLKVFQLVQYIDNGGERT